MARQTDALQRFEALHRQLTQERRELRLRLAALDGVLGDGDTESGTEVLPTSTMSQTHQPARDPGMREAIQQAVSRQPLGVRDIVNAIQQLGFRFKSKNPYNSVGAYLYGKEGRRHFRKSDGKFSALTKNSPSATKNGSPSKRRRLSAAGRRAIAEAARKRWAKYNAAKAKR